MGNQVFNIPRVAAADYPVVFKEVFTGNGSATTFTLTGAVLNATFAIGSWDKAKLILTSIGDVTNTSGKALYDSAVPFTRHRIAISNIDANGVVTLDYPPRAENFDIYYWYQPKESDRLATYIRDDVISKVEESEPGIASAIQVNTTAFGKNLSSADDTVQKALDTLDDMAGGGGGLPTGTTTGDMIRYDSISGAWETKHEPLSFSQIILTPSVAAALDAEGGMYYKSGDKSVYVCTAIA